MVRRRWQEEWRRPRSADAAARPHEKLHCTSSSTKTSTSTERRRFSQPASRRGAQAENEGALFAKWPKLAYNAIRSTTRTRHPGRGRQRDWWRCLDHVAWQTLQTACRGSRQDTSQKNVRLHTLSNTGGSLGHNVGTRLLGAALLLARVLDHCEVSAVCGAGAWDTYATCGCTGAHHRRRSWRG